MLLQAVDNVFKHLMDQGWEVVHLVHVAEPYLEATSKCAEAPYIALANVLDVIKVAWLSLSA